MIEIKGKYNTAKIFDALRKTEYEIGICLNKDVENLMMKQLKRGVIYVKKLKIM